MDAQLSEVRRSGSVSRMMQQAGRPACRTTPHSSSLDTPRDILARPLCTPCTLSEPIRLQLMNARAHARASSATQAVTWRRRPAVTSREEGTCLRGAIHYAWVPLPETLSHYSDP